MVAFEEKRLINLLREFDINITLSYLEKLKMFKHEAEAQGLINSLIPIKDPSLIDPIAFRVNFSGPLLVMLSHPICRLHMRVHYPIEYEWEQFYVTQLGILPIYFADLNLITLIKFWSEAAQQASPQALINILTPETQCMKMSPSNKDIMYSTMNFIIPFGADLRKAPQFMDEIMRSYFKYSFWLSPKPGFSFSTHILHTKASIKYLLKVAKTLCLIDDIDGNTQVQILNKVIKVHKVIIRMLTVKDRDFFFLKRKTYIPDDVLNDLLSPQSQDRISIKRSFLNAVVLEVRGKTDSFEILTVVSDIGASYFELIQTLISMSLMRIFNSNDKIAYICDVNELEKSFNNLLDQIHEYIELPITVSDKINNIFELALESLYPIFIKKENKIYHLHPALLNFLQNYSDLLLQKNNKGKVIKFLDFLEKIGRNVRYMELYLDETLDMFYSKNKKETLSTLFRLARIIKITKLLQRCF